MKPEFSDAKRVFLEAIERYQSHEWDAFVSKECGHDTESLQRVRELLAGHRRSSDTVTPGLDTVTIGESTGDHVGPYLLLEQLGEGGFGIVYRAQQLYPLRRCVALKLLKPGIDSRRIIARFEAERQALALMQHPNIANVLDAGATPSGRPYFAMELVNGISITEYCCRERLTLEQRLRLMVDVCRAVQHAHQKGIIHRDLKPNNVLVTVDEHPATVKVIDFGVAKALAPTDREATLLTGEFQLIGTPMYMSPEQATLGTIDVDTRSDIYSLGVLLYEMLTGVTPFDSKLQKRLGPEELLQLIRHQDPPRPSVRIQKFEANQRDEIARDRQLDSREFSRKIKSELDWIVMKAIDKKRELRYQSTGALASDITRFLEHKPVEACPPSRRYLAKKFLNRHRLATGLSLSVGLSLILVTAISLWQIRETRKANWLASQRLANEMLAKQQVITREAQLRKLLYVGEMKSAWQAWRSGSALAARKIHQRHMPQLGFEDLRDFAWYYLDRQLGAELVRLQGHAAPILEASVSPNSRLVASGDRAGHVLIWDLKSGALLRELHYDTKEVNSVAFSPDSRSLATAGQDSQIHLWDTNTWQEIRSMGRHDGTITNISWSPDGQAIASGGRDQAVRIWDPQSGECIQHFANLNDVVRSVAWSPDGTQLAAADGNTLRLWDTHSWQLRQHWNDQPYAIHSVAFSPDGRQIAAAGFGVDIWVYDTDPPTTAAVINGDEHFWWVTFSPDNRHLLAGSSQDGPRIWRRNDRAFDRIFATQESTGNCVRSVLFADQGNKLVVGFENAMYLSVFDYGQLFGYSSRQFDQPLLALNGRHDLRATLAADGSIQINRFSSGESIASLSDIRPPITAATFSASGKMLATASQQQLAVCDVQPAATWRSLPDAPWPVLRLLFSPSAALLACCNETGDVRMMEVASGQVLGDFESKAFPGLNFAFSPDESLLASTRDANFIQLWSTGDGQMRSEIRTRSLRGLQFSPDGKIIFGGGEQGVDCWRVEDGQLWASLAHTHPVKDIAISPDGRTLASVDSAQTVRLWHLGTQQEMFSLLQGEHRAEWVQFASPSKLVVGANLADSPHPGVVVFDATP